MSEPTLELTAYAANCHCGAVRLTVNIPSLTDHKVMSCNCSLCTRNGYLNVYAERKDVIFHSGADNLSTYPIQNMNAHKFCSTCGSSMIALYFTLPHTFPWSAHGVLILLMEYS